MKTVLIRLWTDATFLATVVVGVLTGVGAAATAGLLPVSVGLWAGVGLAVLTGMGVTAAAKPVVKKVQRK